MPGADIAQYGIAIFAVAILGYVFVKVFAQQPQNKVELTKVIENNTIAIQELMKLIREMQIEITKEQMKLDEMLDIMRHTKRKGKDEQIF